SSCACHANAKSVDDLAALEPPTWPRVDPLGDDLRLLLGFGVPANGNRDQARPGARSKLDIGMAGADCQCDRLAVQAIGVWPIPVLAREVRQVEQRCQAMRFAVRRAERG